MNANKGFEEKKIKRILKDIYQEYVSGNLTEEAYEKIRKKYEKKLGELRKLSKPPKSSFFHSLEFLMALRNLSRRKTRTALTILGIVVGVIAIISLASVSEGMYRQMVGWVESSMGSDLIVMHIGSNQFMPQEKIPEEYVERILQIPNIKSAFPELFEVGIVKGSKVLIRGVALDAKLKQITIISGSSLSESPNQVLIGWKLQKKLNIEVNDYISIHSLHHNGKDFKVVGVFQSTSGFMDESCIMPIAAVQEIFSETGKASMILVDVSDVKYIDAVKREIENSFKGIQVIEQKVVVKAIQQGTRILKSFLMIVASISLIVAGLGIMNTMFMSIMERKREIGILKAVGASKTQIMKGFLIEAFLLGIMGGGFGCLLGVAVSKIAEFLATQCFHIPVASYISPSILLLGFLFALLSALIFGSYPCWRAASLNPVEALKHG